VVDTVEKYLYTCKSISIILDYRRSDLGNYRHDNENGIELDNRREFQVKIWNYILRRKLCSIRVESTSTLMFEATI